MYSIPKMSKVRPNTVTQAHQSLELGFAAFLRGNIKKARNHFKSSAKFHATADALCYWGWMEHQLGNTALAIYLCYKAIQIDPEFGNPYNDIGSYLISMGKLDEAIPWLEKAIDAKRYEPRQFPYMNLGRVYLAKSQPRNALTAFQKALQYAPASTELSNIVALIQNSMH